MPRNRAADALAIPSPVQLGRLGVFSGMTLRAKTDDGAPRAVGPAGAARLDVIDRTGRVEASSLRWLADHARLALDALGGRGEVRVAVADDAAMADAHVRYAGLAGTTDVLTFDMSERDGELDADILVCLDEAQRQAQRRDGSAERELLLYVVHGLLHCVGFDDRDAASASAMHRREDEVLTAIGVGPVYARGGEP